MDEETLPYPRNITLSGGISRWQKTLNQLLMILHKNSVVHQYPKLIDESLAVILIALAYPVSIAEKNLPLLLL
jgi:hypothetical protein